MGGKDETVAGNSDQIPRRESQTLRPSLLKFIQDDGSQTGTGPSATRIDIRLKSDSGGLHLSCRWEGRAIVEEM
jgi:hypothetical protein